MLKLAAAVLVAFGAKHMTCHQRVICYCETESCQIILIIAEKKAR